jgi:hypothetical protein
MPGDDAENLHAPYFTASADSSRRNAIKAEAGSEGDEGVAAGNSGPSRIYSMKPRMDTDKH